MAPARSGLGLALGMMMSFLLALSMSVYAQTNPQHTSALNRPSKRQASITPLVIGDTIPDVLWHLPLQVVNHPEGKDTVTLNDYRNKKLIVLDFWATWCKPCIKSVMKLDTIVADLGEENIALLPVQVYDLVPNAHRFIEKRDWHLPTIVGDTLLSKVAFYNYLTGFGVVWLADGKLLAVPQSKDVNRSNVIKALRREPLNIEHRKGYPLLTQ